VLVLLLGAFTSFNASAAINVGAYRIGMAMPETKEGVEMYVNGLRDGIIALDAYRQRYENVKQKFCIKDINLDQEGTLAIINVELANPSQGIPYTDDVPIVFVLIKALQRFAPCK
jgi:hypothetical protein